MYNLYNWLVKNQWGTHVLESLDITESNNFADS